MADWYTTVSDAEWGRFSDVKATFNSADYIADGKIVFDVGGNKYRVIMAIDYQRQLGFIRFVGTHAQYDQINAETV